MPRVRAAAERPHLLVAALLIVLALALLPSWGRERHLIRAQDDLAGNPLAALRLGREAEGPGTLERAQRVQADALVALGRPGAASRTLEAMVRRTPGNPLLLRRVLAVEQLRGERSAARATRAHLRRLDPRFVAGTGL